MVSPPPEQEKGRGRECQAGGPETLNSQSQWYREAADSNPGGSVFEENVCEKQNFF